MIVQDRKCFFCGRMDSLEVHHTLHGWANRKKAEQYGLTIYLCTYHHTGGLKSVHRNYDMDLQVKQFAQKYFEENIGSRELFIKEFGRNYL